MQFETAADDRPGSRRPGDPPPPGSRRRQVGGDLRKHISTTTNEAAEVALNILWR